MYYCYNKRLSCFLSSTIYHRTATQNCSYIFENCTVALKIHCRVSSLTGGESGEKLFRKGETMAYTDEQIAWLDKDDLELKRAWETFTDPVQENAGECLQYMGSSIREGAWWHCFRHRCSPETGGRKYYDVKAPDNWAPKEARGLPTE
jgi:hypothetical protein